MTITIIVMTMIVMTIKRMTDERQTISCKNPSLAGFKWLLTALSVAGTLGLWQVFAGNRDQDSRVNTGNVGNQQTLANEFPRVEAGVPAGFRQFPPDIPVKIIVAEAQAPRPLAVTRSS